MYKHPFANAVSTRHWYQRPVTWAFGFLLALIALITLLAIFSLQRIEKEFFQETLVKIEKLRLLDEMVHHSRQRSVLLRDLVIARDPFDQDEINQKHSTLATRYLLARTALAEQPLNNDEQNILNRIIELNSSAYETQQKIMGLRYNAHGLLWAKDLRVHVPPLTNIRYDPTHCMFCSGVAQREVELLLAKLASLDTASCTWDALRAFMGTDWRACKAVGGSRAASKFSAPFSTARGNILRRLAISQVVLRKCCTYWHRFDRFWLPASLG